MEIKARFDHFNINVTDLERSLAFYDRALGLKEISRKQADDGSFILAYLGDGETGFRIFSPAASKSPAAISIL